MAYIEGYGSTLSVAPGDELPLHVSTDVKNFDIEILREGAETKSFGRVTNIAGAKHPIPELAFQRGCGWPVSHTLKIDRDWPSGVYRVRLVADEKSKYDVLVVVRSARPGKTSPMLMELTTNTYQAYNAWGGHSHYGYNSVGKMRSAVLSYHRPGIGIYSDCHINAWEVPFIRWAESKGYTLDYAINSDLEFRPDLLSNYKLMLSVGHDEYWSWGMRDTVENYISKGGNVAFFTGNAVCWQIRYEDEGRTQRCHKEAGDEDPIFMLGDQRKMTTRWNHPTIKRPENQLTGVGWEHGGYHRSHGMHMDGSGAYKVARAEHWIYEGTGLKDGDEFGGEHTIVGYECDGCRFKLGSDGRPYATGEDGTPLNFQILAQAPALQYKDAPPGSACLGMYERGGTVFTAATTDWSHGLRGGDRHVEQITHNILRRLSK